MGGGNVVGDPVKVVIINTQYVETDAVSFKSVVQKLTGKDSTLAAAATKQRRSRSRTEVAAGYNKAPAMDRVMSFKDFDRMLKDLSPLDELSRLYAE